MRFFIDYWSEIYKNLSKCTMHRKQMPPVKRSEKLIISWSPRFLINLNLDIEKVWFWDLKTIPNQVSGDFLEPMGILLAIKIMTF